MSTQQDEPPPTPFVGLGDPADTEQDPLGRARHALRSRTPGADVAAILELDVNPTDLRHTRQLIVGGVEELTGLRAGELQALSAVSEGADHHRAIARVTGQADAAAAATVDGLVRKGMLLQHHHPAEPNARAAPTLVHLSPKGEALIGQAEAIRIRLLDTLAQSLDEDALAQVRSAADVLRPSITRVGESRQIGGPAAS